MAARVLTAISDSGARPLILAADPRVMDWAEQEGWEAVLDREPSLNAAARGAVHRAWERNMAWMVVHADLPLVTRADMVGAVEAVGSRSWVLSPSSDGGTSLVGGSGRADLRFAYGRGSFHRHLGRLRNRSPRVLFRPGLALDLDRPSDLRAALSHPRGAWLVGVLTEKERGAVSRANRG